MALGNTPRSRTNVYLDRSKSFSFELEFENTDGSAFPLTGCTVRLVVEAPQRYGGDEVINMVSTHDTEDDNVTRFPLQASDLALEPGEYPYDVTLIDEQQYSSPILKGVFVMGDNTDDDATNTYTGVDPANGVLIVMGGSEAVKVVVDYPVGVKGDKGDKGDPGDPTGVFVQPDEPGPDDEPPADSALWVDTDDDSGHDHSGEYAPIVHDHDDAYYTQTYLDILFGNVAAINHDHDSRYYTEAEVDSKLAGKAAVSHEHDSRYYTEAEMDSKLAGKAAVSHDHDSRYYTESEVDAKLAGKSNTGHNHDGSYAALAHAHDERYYTESEVDSKLAGKSNTSHNHDGQYAAPDHHHDDLYYGEAEVDTLLDGKSDTGHDHDGRYATPADLRTESILSEAVWHVDANMLTAGNDGLADQSGNGRDAVFGAGAAAPLVLPWDGEDYLAHVGSAANTNCLSTGTVSAPIALDATIRAEVAVPKNGVSFYLIYSNTLNNNVRIYANNTNLWVRFTDAAGTVGMVVWSAAVPDDVRCSIEVRLTADSAHLFVDGADLGAKAIGVARTAANSQQMTLFLGGGGGPACRAWGLTVDDVVILDPRNVNADYTEIANTGTAGGHWDISRADTGYKTAVVDRPLLLFGGGQYATTSSPLPAAAEETLLIAFRQFGIASGVQRFLWALSGTSSPYDGGAYLYGQSTGAIVAEAHKEGNAGAQTLSARLAGTYGGQEVVAMRLSATDYTVQPSGLTAGRQAGTRLIDPAAPLSIGNYQGSSSGVQGEFIAAAIFDRALTDDEVAQASLELQGVPHYKQPDPHPQYVLRSEQTRVSRPNGTDRLVEVFDPTANGGSGGWVVTHYDSGWRDISSQMLPGFIAALGGGNLAVCKARRVGPHVEIRMRTSGTSAFTSAPARVETWMLPDGWQPEDFQVWGDVWRGNTCDGRADTSATIGRLDLVADASWSSNASRSAVARWVTEQTIPTSLPGTPLGTAP